MNALTRHVDELPLDEPRNNVIQTDAAGLMGAITRAASDPNMDADKLDRLLSAYERISAQKARVAYASAIATLQPLLPVITERGGIKNTKGEIQSTYALWEDITDAIRPLMSAHGFALTFKIGNAGDRITVTAVLSHKDGHSEETTFALPADKSGAKNDVQAIGSAVSYAKRYTALALLNITTRGEDDDGKAGGVRSMSTLAQAALSAINLCSDAAELKAWKVKNADGIQTLDAPEQEEIIRLFNARARKVKEGAA